MVLLEPLELKYLPSVARQVYVFAMRTLPYDMGTRHIWPSVPLDGKVLAKNMPRLLSAAFAVAPPVPPLATGIGVAMPAWKTRWLLQLLFTAVHTGFIAGRAHLQHAAVVSGGIIPGSEA